MVESSQERENALLEYHEALLLNYAGIKTKGASGNYVNRNKFEKRMRSDNTYRTIGKGTKNQRSEPYKAETKPSIKLIGEWLQTCSDETLVEMLNEYEIPYNDKQSLSEITEQTSTLNSTNQSSIQSENLSFQSEKFSQPQKEKDDISKKFEEVAEEPVPLESEGNEEETKDDRQMLGNLGQNKALSNMSKVFNKHATQVKQKGFYNFIAGNQVEQLALQLIDLDQKASFNLFAPENRLRLQNHVKSKEIVESVKDKIQLIYLARHKNPKAFQLMEMLFSKLIKSDPNSQMPQGMRQIHNVVQGTEGSLEINTNLAGQTGTQNQMPSQGAVSMTIVADKDVTGNQKKDVVTHLIEIIQNPQKYPEEVRKYAQEILEKHSNKAKLDAKALQQPGAKQSLKVTKQAKLDLSRQVTINADNRSNLPVFPKENGAETMPPQAANRIILSLLDPIQSESVEQAMQFKQQEQSLTDAQKQYYVQSATDENRAAFNYKNIDGWYPNAGKNKFNPQMYQYMLKAVEELRKKNPKISSDPKKIMLQGNYSELPKIMTETSFGTNEKGEQQFQHKYATAPGLYGQKPQKPQRKPVIVPEEIKKASEGPRGNVTAKVVMTLFDYFQYLNDSADYISKIAGDLSNPDLRSYKTQTAIFTTSIVKKEPGEFKIAPNSMYKVRDCC